MTHDEIAEVLKLVEAAMRGELRPVGQVTHPNLSPEWRVRMNFRAGGCQLVDVADEAEALEKAARLRPGGWTIERRLVSAWAPVAPPPGHGAARPGGGD